MKKFIKYLFIVCLLVVLVGCKPAESHEHDYSETVIKPTCDEKGYTEYKCSCGHSYIDNEVAPKGHSYIVTNVIKEATETEVGSQEKTCIICGDKITVEIPLKEHVHVYTSKVIAPTCTTQGYTEHKCSCGDTHVTDEVDALDHYYSDWKIIKDATETEVGSREKICLRCNDKIVEDIPLKEHVHVYTSTVVEPTCTEKGYTEHKCSCGNSYRTAEKEALDHFYSSWVVTKEATETEAGSREKICIRCNDKVVEEIPVKEHVHIYTSTAVEPTCIKNGYTKHTCNCGDSYISDEVDALDHYYSDWKIIKDATETEVGSREKICLRCNDKVVEEIPVKEHVHNFVHNVVNPTCTEKGYTEHTCNCGESYIDSYVSALGHSEEVIPGKEPTYAETGLSDGIKCSVCHKILKAQEVLPVLVQNTYSIVWKNVLDSEYPELVSYKEGVGVSPDEMPDLYRTGYDFEGWYETSECITGQRVDYIPTNKVGTIYLYAKWSEPHIYSIEYKNAPIHTNPEEYTVEDSIVLSAPKWEGDSLYFSHWEDEDGNEITSVEQGTTGNLVIYACWQAKENYVHNIDHNGEFEAVYDEVENRYYFLYKIGEIKNIVLSKIESYIKNSASSHSWSNYKTVTLEESISESVSNTVGSHVTNSESWQETIENATSNSLSTGGSISLETDIRVPGVAKVREELTIEIKETDTTSYSEAKTNGGENSFGTSKEESLESSVIFNSSISERFGSTDTILGDAPNGTYDLVVVGNVNVYMILTYDVDDECFYINIYSLIKNDISESVLFTPDNVNLEVLPSDELSYEVPFVDMRAYIDNSYKVSFDANSGEGSMSTVAYEVDETTRLPKNTFTKFGYDFVGWSTSPDGDILYSDTQTICNIAEKQGEVTLYAKWQPKRLTISFDLSGGQHTSSEIDVIYGDKYAGLTNPTRLGYTFKGWYYEDVKITSSSVVTAAIPHTLVAKWEKNIYKVIYNSTNVTGEMSIQYFEYGVAQALSACTFTKEGHYFKGWATSLNGSVVYKDVQSIKFIDATSKTITLYPVMEKRTYTITIYDESDFRLSDPLYELEYKYGQKITMPNIDKPSHIFYDWGSDIPTYMPAYDMIIFASFVDEKLYFKEGLSYHRYNATSVIISNTTHIVYTITDSGREHQPYDKLQLSDLAKYRELGYTKATITVSIDISEENSGYQYIFFYGNTHFQNVFLKDEIILKDINGNNCKFEIEHGGPGSPTKAFNTHQVSATVSLDTLIKAEDDFDNLYIVYGADGDNADTWYNKNLVVTITFSK